MKTSLLPPPVTAAECSAKWIATRREVIARLRVPIRAGGGNTIELRSLTPPEQLASWDKLKMNPWCPMLLPNDAHSFASAGDRDVVLAQLTAPLAAEPSTLTS